MDEKFSFKPGDRALAYISDLMKSRRAVFPKNFEKRGIATERIVALLENANWAPTHKHTEPWRFKVLQGEALTQLGIFLAEDYKKNTTTERFQEAKYRKRLENPSRSAAVIAICLLRDPKESLPEWEELAAVACAVQNLWLSVTAAGLGGYWSSPAAIIGRPSILPLDDGEKCMGLFYLGHPAQVPGIGRRGRVEDKISWLSRLP